MTAKIIAKIIKPFLRALDILTPVGDLLARFYIAHIFLQSGIEKLSSWQDTLLLFSNVYDVPLMPPYLAAVTSTGLELILPVLLILGLGGRLMVLLFFVYNVMIVVSYPFFWTADGAMGLSQHVNWGLLLMLLMFHGPGKLSLDYWIRKRHGHHLA